jgi:hypothetical protein
MCVFEVSVVSNPQSITLVYLSIYLSTPLLRIQYQKHEGFYDLINITLFMNLSFISNPNHQNDDAQIHNK